MKIPKVFYEVFVRSFCDSNNDGIGDINGVIKKLDYLQELGIEGIWLMPINPSPSYHKYDITDYYGIDSQYGSMQDFENLISEASKRGIEILIDLVINHTSSKHYWFQDAKDDVKSKYRDYYIWKTPQGIQELGAAERKATADSQERNPWHYARKNDDEKYFGMFWSEMPDLNYESENLKKEIFEIGKYWLKKGVLGFRLDAAKHLFPPWTEHKTPDFWREFRFEMQTVNPEVYLVGEVWTSAEKIAPFFKGLTANFNFDLSENIQNIVKDKCEHLDIVGSLINTYKIFSEVSPDFVDATMLSNHDQERIGTAANGNIEKLKMAATLLLTLPGNPYLYYGEELGMLGPKPDENIREAFLWNTRFEDIDRTNWGKPKYNTDSKVSPLSIQLQDKNSLFNHYKTLIQLRKRHDALSQIQNPNLEKTDIDHKEIISFIRPNAEADVFVIQNVGQKIISIELLYTVTDVLFSYKSSLSYNKLELQAYGSMIALIKKY